MKPSVTPLRYPGGKTWLLGYVRKFIEFHKLESLTVIEPYAGSASISIGLLNNNIVDRAYLCEKDPLIVAFWNAILKHNDELVESLRLLEVSLDTWHSFKKYLSREAAEKFNIQDLALAFLFYNRANFSGIINAGPLGGKKQISQYKIDCRFNKERLVKKIKKLGEFTDRIQVVLGDGVQFMKSTLSSSDIDNLFFYVDPPYYNAGKVLYRHYFTEKDHTDLSDFLKSLDSPWLLSYDDSEIIKSLYRANTTSPVYTDYQSGHFKKGVKELLISNRLIPPFSPEVSYDKQASKNKLSVIDKLECNII